MAECIEESGNLVVVVGFANLEVVRANVDGV